MSESQHPIQLIVQYYRCADSARQAEIDTCLRHNLQNPFISKVHLLTEELFEFSHYDNYEKIIQSVISERLSFERAFLYANDVDPSGARIWVLSNADIYFDDTLRLVEWKNLDGVIYALTRHDVQLDGSIRLVPLEYAHGCQDTWIFKTTVLLEKVFTAYYLGIPGCDNRLVYEFVRAGYRIINPAKTIITRHLDLIRDDAINDRVRHYFEMTTEVNIDAGRVAPPPYLGEIYPTDDLKLADREELQIYFNVLNDFAEHVRYINELRTQVTVLEHSSIERDRQIADRDRQIADRDRQIADRDRQIADRDRQIVARELKIQSLLTSASWKLTAPLRSVHEKLPVIRNEIIKAVHLLTKPNGKNFNLDLSELRDKIVHKHRKPVDIIVCVHDALEDVKVCLESILKHTEPPYSLIIVDDGSGLKTSDYLKNFTQNTNSCLIRNEEAKGYTFAANQGLRSSSGAYAVLLNSDTIVTPEWLGRMIMCAESDPKIGLVGPLSNTASWQSIPEIEEGGDWALNPLPSGTAVDDMAMMVSDWSGMVYPRIAFLNGFCLMIKRAVIDRIGYFDEKVFARGYGEENDYCIRTRKAGWSLAVADDVFIFHAQSKSYSTDRRKKLSDLAGIALAKKHGDQIINEGVIFCREDRVLAGMRVRSRLLYERQSLVYTARLQWGGKKVVFVLPIRIAGGGGNVVISEALAMRKMGVDVSILNLSEYRDSFEKAYPNLNLPVIFASSEKEIPALCCDVDVVIATANFSVRWLKPLTGKTVIGYYIQDFEPYFYPEESEGYYEAWESYTLIPEMVRFTKTDWNKDELWKLIGCDCTVVGPSCEVDLFRPRVRKGPSWPMRALRIAAMIRPDSPRRNPEVTMKVLREVSKQFKRSVEIILFGADSHDPVFLSITTESHWRILGKQTSPQLALLFNEVDIFVDFSIFQAMGLTAMEAMACGVAVIVPSAGGGNSFAVNEENALVIDTTSESDCLTALNYLIIDHCLREKLQQRAIEDVPRFYPEVVAVKILAALFVDKQITVTDNLY